MTGLDSRRAVTGTVLFFIANGLVIGTFGSMIPLFRDRFDLAPSHVAVILFCSGLAALAGMQISGRLSDSLGAVRMSIWSVPALAVGALVVAFAPNYSVLIVGGVFVGISHGALDVSMNALAVQVEQARGKPIMSRFHGCWSIGSFGGAALVLVLGTLVSGPALIATGFLGMGIVVSGIVLLTGCSVPETQRVNHEKTPDGRLRVPAIAYLLGAMAMFAGLGEGTAADWSSLHVVEVCLVAPEQGAVGLAAVSSCMVIIRFLGDSIVARWGRRTTAAAGGAVAAAGYLLVATQSHLGIVLCGWSLVGLGVGLIAPQVYGAAGRLGGGRTLATVVTFGYTAFLAGPAVMGAIIGYFGMQHAMLFPAALCLVIVGFSRWFPNVEAN